MVPRSCPGPACSPTPSTASSWSAVRRATHVRLDIFPDGGISRLRLHGSLTPAGAAALADRAAELS